MTDTDRELLKLAAKSIDIRITGWGEADLYSRRKGDVAYIFGREWNPLTDNTDAVELAVELAGDYDFLHDENSKDFFRGAVEAQKPHNDNPFADYDRRAATRRAIGEAVEEIGAAATRRVIVITAAEIGKGMK
jgi:hypothetical protein